MYILKLEILYDGVFLERVNPSKEYSIREIVEILNNYKKSISIKIVNLEMEPMFQLNVKEYLVIDYICDVINIKLKPESLKIIRYLSMIYSLSENNFGVVDDHIIKNNSPVIVNYAEVIAERNYLISKHFLINYFNEKNLLICYLFIRDLIENIKVYLFFLRGSIEEETIKFSNGFAIRHNVNQKVKDDIHNKLENENQSWEFDIKDIIKHNPSLKVWGLELKKLKEYNELCNAYIHKNGFTKISPRYINRVSGNQLLEIWYDVIKFYFTITAAYDGKSIESSDYMDYVEMGEEPPDGCQCWVAPIFQEFIDLEFTEDEKKKIQYESYMDIK